ncbi:ComEA family DNA-binding protein [Nocardioides sp. SYSU D00038]|uniref:ComEA family DNA-binding protein n=1 Tax=Nocardioides sp. SYSU D00038 TaxID=2812554 RepID=UPI0019676A16|nr:ComEA family DNA-binding protein [Nocardioides sp. SYSU D00038]
MRTRRAQTAHQEAVSRRLALLGDQLAVPVDHLVSPAPPPPPPAGSPPAPHRPSWWDDHTRLAADRHPPPPRDPAGPPALPPLLSSGEPVPRPGRHAARRRSRPSGPPGLPALPATLRGPAGLGPAQLTVVALLLVVALGVTCWWLARSEPEEVAAAPRPGPSGALVPVPDTPLRPVAGGSPTVPEAGGAAASAGGTVTVDVTGKVRRPGIAVLDAGSRVVDALAAAGGARRGVDLSTLNLARLLVDGEQVVVGEPVPAGVPLPVGSTSGQAGGAAAPGPLVDLNTASAVELESLPEVGPVTAQAILDWRGEHGGFTAVDELLEVDGIGPATLETLAPLVTV